MNFGNGGTVLLVFSIIVFVFAVTQWSWMSYLIFAWCMIGGTFLAQLFLLFNPSVPNLFVRIGTNLEDSNKIEACDRTSLSPSNIENSLKVPTVINCALEEFLELLLQTFVYEAWYNDVSTDDCFMSELRSNARHIVAALLWRLRKLNLSTLLLKRLLPVALNHLDAYAHAVQDFGDLNHLDQPAIYFIEQRVLSRLRPKLHRAVISRDAELNYLRKLAQLVSDYSLPKDPSGCEATRVFVREILTLRILLPIADAIADPDVLNYAFILLFSAEPMKVFQDLPSEETLLLDNLMRSCRSRFTSNTSDSLVQVKVTEICRDASSLYTFMNFMRTNNGPDDYLKCLFDTQELLDRIIEVKRKTELCDDDWNFFNWQVWEFFRTYLHESSNSTIEFPSDIVAEFTSLIEVKETSVESGALPPPDCRMYQLTINERIFRLYEVLHSSSRFISEKLQKDGWLEQFCQSDKFFELLIGSKHVSVFTDGDELSNLTRNPDSWMKFSTLKSKLSNVFSSSIQDGLLPQPSSGDMLIVDKRTRWLRDNSIEVNGGSTMRRRFSVPSGIDKIHTLSDDLLKVDSSNIPTTSGSSYELGNECDGDDEDELFDLNDDRSAAVLLDDEYLSQRNFSIPGDEDSDSGCSQGLADFAAPSLDLTQWAVSIPRIEPRREPQTMRTMYVYVLDLHRKDLSPSRHANHWTVDRRYNEFYVLESKLAEFHGPAILQLPPKKTFGLGTKTRAFVESMRPHFDCFIKRLLSIDALKGSQLLYSFLTDPVEFTTSFLPDLNPFKVISKVPSKLIKERGQNLHQFLRTLVNNVETFRYRLKPVVGRFQPQAAGGDSASLLNGHQSQVMLVKSISDVRSEASTASNLSIEDVFKDRIFNSIFGNNFASKLDSSEKDVQVSKKVITSSIPLQSPIQSVYDSLLYVLLKLYKCPRWFYAVLVGLRALVKESFDFCIDRTLSKILLIALHERRIEEWIHAARDLIFFDDGTSRTEHERQERSVAACRTINEFFTANMPAAVRLAVGEQRLIAGNRIWFECLQNPVLNKQLLYCLLDVLIEEAFNVNFN